MELSITGNDNTYTNSTRIKIRIKKSISRELSPKKQMESELEKSVIQGVRNTSLARIIAQKNVLKLRKLKSETTGNTYCTAKPQINARKLIELSQRKDSFQILEDAKKLHSEAAEKKSKVPRLALPDDVGFRSIVSFVKDIKGILSAPQTYRKQEAKQSIDHIKRLASKLSKAKNLHSSKPLCASQSKLLTAQDKDLRHGSKSKPMLLRKIGQANTMPEIELKEVRHGDSDVLIVPKLTTIFEHALLNLSVGNIKFILPPL